MIEVPRRPAALLDGRVALVVGGGQTSGESVGNGRATALLFAREGAHVVVADRDEASALATVEQIRELGGAASAVTVDVTDEARIVDMVEAAKAVTGRIDVLHNNVGASISAGDAPVTEITVEGFDAVFALNLRSMVLTCKHVLPVMRSQGSGAIVNISSTAAIFDYRNIAYKTSKAGVNALTGSLAISNAEYGIRVNAIMPGLINTPMAIESRVRLQGADRDAVTAARDSQVPLGGKMGTAWDIARAALFLASDEASFVTGVVLTVDGGQSLQVG